MKLVQAKDGRLVFELDSRQLACLHHLTEMYPQVPLAHHVVTRGECDPKLADCQNLLQSALAEQRAQHQAAIRGFWSDAGRLRQHKGKVRLTVDAAQANWLLEILNDIRVGSWLKLGSPDPKGGADLEMTEEIAPIFWAMEMSGFFQMRLLEAIHPSESSEA